jgi:hypothetical protein
MEELIPPYIWNLLIQDSLSVQYTGFAKLFVYLNTEPTANELRKLVVDYFNDRPYFQPHLRVPLSRLSFHHILE